VGDDCNIANFFWVEHSSNNGFSSSELIFSSHYLTGVFSLLEISKNGVYYESK
jgi:hypothetical protein